MVCQGNHCLTSSAKETDSEFPSKCSVLSSASVVALNADMLDSDFNHVKVELFCAQFKNLANERCFLVGLRELQDLDPPHVTPIGRGEALLVVFDLHTFHIHII